jgi:hypothetical protein
MPYAELHGKLHQPVHACKVIDHNTAAAAAAAASLAGHDEGDG